MVNAVESLWRHAEGRGSHPALRVSGQTWTYAQMWDEIASWACHLRDTGVAQGDRVLLVASSSAAYVMAYHGILAIGAVAVTVNPTSTSSELTYFVEDSGATLVVAGPDCFHKVTHVAQAAGVNLIPLESPGSLDPDPHFQPASPPEPGGAVIMYTSGTTGRPKGAELSHANLVLSAASVAEALELDTDVRWGAALPLFHVFGQVTVMRTTLQLGGTMSLLPRFGAAELLEMTIQHRLTVLGGVPTMWNAMVNCPVDFDRSQFTELRWAVSGGAGLPAEIARAFGGRFGCELLTGYGLTETAGAGTCHRRHGPRKERSAGVPWPQVEIDVWGPDRRPLPSGEVGEIVIRAPMVMTGYWNRPEATAEAFHDGWFLTGDLGRTDADGFLWVEDRKKDLIIRGGYNVYPREVEEALEELPAVAAAAVAGLPDRDKGEVVAAWVVPAPGHAAGEEALRRLLDEHLAGRLAAFKRPRRLTFVDALPRNALGKVQKHLLPGR